MSFKKGTDKVFTQVKLLKNAGLLTKDIAQIVQRHPSTISRMSQFESYQDYINYWNNLKSSSIEAAQSARTATMDTQSTVAVYHNEFKVLLDRLESIDNHLIDLINRS